MDARCSSDKILFLVRIGISGESGGGYICAGAAVELARRGEAGLVRVAIPTIPMLSDYPFSDPAAMTQHEAQVAGCQRKVWRLIAGSTSVRGFLLHIKIVLNFIRLKVNEMIHCCSPPMPVVTCSSR